MYPRPQNQNKPGFLKLLIFSVLLVIVGVLVLRDITRPARAADQTDTSYNSTSNYLTGAYTFWGNAFTPHHYNISKVVVIYATHDGGSGHNPNVATTTFTLYDYHDNAIATATSLCELGQANGQGCYYEFEPVQVYAEMPGYYFKIQFSDNGTLAAHYAAVIGSTQGTGILPDALFSGKALALTIYYDDISYNSPPGGEDYKVEVIDSDTFFSTEMTYKFQQGLYCFSEHPEIPCDLKFWYSKKALNVPMYYYYEDMTGSNFNGEFAADNGVIATTTPTNWWSYSATTTLPHISTTTSGYMQYCMQSYSTTTLDTFETCGIKVAWLTDALYEQEMERQTASSSIAAKMTACLDCTEESGIFGCSIKKAFCYLFIPSAEDTMKIYDVKADALNGFPINVYSDLRRTFYDLTASSSATSTGVLAASTTGMYLYWNGQLVSDAPIFTPALIKNGAPVLIDWMNTVLGYLIYAGFTYYVFKRMRQMSAASD